MKKQQKKNSPVNAAEANPNNNIQKDIPCEDFLLTMAMYCGR